MEKEHDCKELSPHRGHLGSCRALIFAWRTPHVRRLPSSAPHVFRIPELGEQAFAGWHCASAQRGTWPMRRVRTLAALATPVRAAERSTPAGTMPLRNMQLPNRSIALRHPLTRPPRTRVLDRTTRRVVTPGSATAQRARASMDSAACCCCGVPPPHPHAPSSSQRRAK